MPMNQLRLLILLSTYNGEKYVAELIESILSQPYKNFELVIRDDGSIDGTLEIINKYATDNKNITLIKGNNLGVIRSFITLLGFEPTIKPDAYLFCDQDDIWLANKLTNTDFNLRTSAHIENALYCSRLNYVDQNLKSLGLSRTPTCVGFNNAIVENIAIGCTMAFGENIRQRILAAPPEWMMMHDWWAYLLASAFGEVIYDNEVTILYRQHGASVTPWEPGLKKINARAKGFFRRLLSEQPKGLDSINQAIRFIEFYHDVPAEHRATVQRLVELRKSGLIARIKYVFSSDVKRTDPLENTLLTPIILLGWH